MKQLILSLLSLLLLSPSIVAQCEYAIPKTDSLEAEGKLILCHAPTKRISVLFAETGGLSKGVFSLNFDRRFGRSYYGWGWRVGASYYQSADLTVATLPIGLNYLIGAGKHHLEVGVGMTPLYIRSTPPQDEEKSFTPAFRNGVMGLIYGTRERKECFNVFGSLTFGYRRQTIGGGFHWGIGLTPTFGRHNGRYFFHPFVPYLSLGYAF